FEGGAMNRPVSRRRMLGLVAIAGPIVGLLACSSPAAPTTAPAPPTAAATTAPAAPTTAPTTAPTPAPTQAPAAPTAAPTPAPPARARTGAAPAAQTRRAAAPTAAPTAAAQPTAAPAASAAVRAAQKGKITFLTTAAYDPLQTSTPATPKVPTALTQLVD